MWNGTHEWLGTYVASLERKDLRRAVFAHPVAGALTVRQAVALIDVHLHTHTRQIRRLQPLLQSADLRGPRA
jgi:transposase